MSCPVSLTCRIHQIAVATPAASSSSLTSVRRATQTNIANAMPAVVEAYQQAFAADPSRTLGAGAATMEVTYNAMQRARNPAPPPQHALETNTAARQLRMLDEMAAGLEAESAERPDDAITLNCRIVLSRSELLRALGLPPEGLARLFPSPSPAPGAVAAPAAPAEAPVAAPAAPATAPVVPNVPVLPDQAYTAPPHPVVPNVPVLPDQAYMAPPHPVIPERAYQPFAFPAPVLPLQGEAQRTRAARPTSTRRGNPPGGAPWGGPEIAGFVLAGPHPLPPGGRSSMSDFDTFLMSCMQLRRYSLHELIGIPKAAALTRGWTRVEDHPVTRVPLESYVRIGSASRNIPDLDHQ